MKQWKELRRFLLSERKKYLKLSNNILVAELGNIIDKMNTLEASNDKKIQK